MYIKADIKLCVMYYRNKSTSGSFIYRDYYRIKPPALGKLDFPIITHYTEPFIIFVNKLRINHTFAPAHLFKIKAVCLSVYFITQLIFLKARTLSLSLAMKQKYIHNL